MTPFRVPRTPREDPLAPSRGCLTGFVVSVVFWAAVALVIYG